jgi:hypothetical protein
MSVYLELVMAVSIVAVTVFLVLLLVQARRTALSVQRLDLVMDHAIAGG